MAHRRRKAAGFTRRSLRSPVRSLGREQWGVGTQQRGWSLGPRRARHRSGACACPRPADVAVRDCGEALKNAALAHIRSVFENGGTPTPRSAHERSWPKFGAALRPTSPRPTHLLVHDGMPSVQSGHSRSRVARRRSIRAHKDRQKSGAFLPSRCLWDLMSGMAAGTPAIRGAIARAFDWLCAQRTKYPDTDSVWSLRASSASVSDELALALVAGDYPFSQWTMMSTRAGARVADAKDAWLLKALALLLDAPGERQSQRAPVSVARVTSLLDQQTLTKERLQKHVKGFVNWAKGGLRRNHRNQISRGTLWRIRTWNFGPAADRALGSAIMWWWYSRCRRNWWAERWVSCWRVDSRFKWGELVLGQWVRRPLL